ncbi:MAG: c-type cytochrome [Bacteroidetes bacterium]|nr:MAG: c-type cytochrome [Bacteroidota bacterium]
MRILRRYFYALLIAVGSALFAFSCSYEEPVDRFSFSPPSSFPPFAYNNSDNPITEAGVQLGRMLFYENALSLDSSINCSSCHIQSHAFSDPGETFSTGVNGKIGKRNAPALFNVGWSPTFMWDGGIVHLDVMPLAPITDSLEMNLNMMVAIHRIQANKRYRMAFQQAFGSDTVTSQRLFYALSQFMMTMVSNRSKYDEHLISHTALNASEERGYQLFQTHCSSCHAEPLLSDFSYANNGLDSVYSDLGRGRITLNPADNGKFKVPSLRNIELTYPYMHDGRFNTLQEVVEHYSHGVQTTNADPRLGGPLNLSIKEKEDLLAFLYTLTDHKFIQDSKFSAP